MRIPRPSPPIPALETLHQGVRYRSRLEARWAVFFDTLAVRHEYEPQGYRTSYGNYLPDFWLPQFSAFAEVKPVGLSREQKGKCAEVAHGTGQPFVLLVGQPDAAWYEAILPRLPASAQPAWVDLGASADTGRLYCWGHGGDRPEWINSTDDYAAAVAAARSARFGT